MLSGTSATGFSELLGMQARERPDALAFSFISDEPDGETHMSFGELHTRASAIAAELAGRARPGARVLLLHPPGIEYVCAIFACFHAGTVAVPCVPPSPRRMHRMLPRLLELAQNAQAEVVLTTATIEQAARPLACGDGPLAQASWLSPSADGVAPDGWEPFQGEPSDVALLQYTSGSTMSPRGVVISHANLLANASLIAQRFGMSVDTCGFNWLPPYHDMGLIGTILQAIFCGCRSVMSSPISVVRRPSFWLESISRFAATISGGPNFAYDLCVERIEEASLESLDLSSWEVAFNGAEPVRAETIDAFSERFGQCGFRKRAFLVCYGLAESTLMSTAAGRQAEPTVRTFEPGPLAHGAAVERPLGKALVGCGTIADGHELRIVDPESMRACPEGQVGEIWLRGPSVASEYWRRPEETIQTFGVSIAGAPSDGPFLRTGDLGFLQEGELFVVGRMKELMIIRGVNHYPHDIEAVAERAHPVLRRHCSAAFALDEATSCERLALVLEVNELDSEPLEVFEAVRMAVAQDLGLPLRLIALWPPGAVPKTTSGKVQRRLCCELLGEDEVDAVALWQDGEVN